MDTNFYHSCRLCASHKIFLIFIAYVFHIAMFNSVYASVADGTWTSYDTKVKVGNAYKTVRTVIKNPKFKSSVQGLILATTVAYVGDEVVTRYQNGEFDSSIESIKTGIAEMYANGQKAGGWLGQQFQNLSNKYSCKNGECIDTTASANYLDAKFDGVTFCRINLCAQSVGEVTSQLSEGTADYSYTYSLSSVDFLNTTSTNGKFGVQRTCISKTGGAVCNGQVTLTNNIEFIFYKTAAPVVPNSDTEVRPIVTQMDIAKDVETPSTDQQVADVATLCYLTNCNSISIQRSVDSTYPISTTASGKTIPSDITYPDSATQEDISTYPDLNDSTNSTGSDSSSIAATYPAFCTVAKAACDFFDYMKSKVDAASNYFNEQPSDQTNVNIETPAPISIDTDIKFNGQCPAPLTYDFNYGGQSQKFGITDFSPFCSMLSDIMKPIVIAISSFAAVLIVSGVRTNE
ncbi:virulence factor TspB C-terminal domain-related protein [Acinetobacter baumannii]|uniref:virulence factor TspB C-terminal domain-related protein n=1 Tax=Acinetobacter baumannii TaxID=470 RepID=UPI0024497747|nr:virulence factor TspB C-terminal domain-related protein [Acinetobacter baumannii]MDH2601871.1 virulence factor TspB C-terminal domain-related protein [Acinetobacter baumannii]